MSKARRIIGAAIGDCVHVGGVVRFLQLAEQFGFDAKNLGPAVPIDRLLDEVEAFDPEIVAVGYRLTPDSARAVFADLSAAAGARGQLDRRWVLGGTDPVAEVGRAAGMFHAVFGGTADFQELIDFLRGTTVSHTGGPPPQTLVERIRWKAPVPLIRHHFGQPSVAGTVRGIEEIADAGVLDVLSIGPDQNAQEHFFRPSEMDPLQHGAGGVPLRTPADLAALYGATRRGNFPLVRCYSGTRDLLRWGEMALREIRNAWLAVPLFWYSRLDGRSQRPLTESIPEAQAVMRWYAERGVPVEMNESHHWSLRDAPDVVAVAAAYLAAYNARAAGVADYVQQLMWNTPPPTSPAMDLAKMLAKLDLVGQLEGASFRVIRETRAGLTSMPAQTHRASGHLAATTLLQMAVKPHIVHVVGHSEADHAATAHEVIESCRVARGAIDLALLGLPDMAVDPRVGERREELREEARVLLAAVRDLAGPGVTDPFTDAGTLARAVEIGLLDAPHLRGNGAARGEVAVRFIDGKCLAVDPASGRPLSERQRVAALLRRQRVVA